MNTEPHAQMLEALLELQSQAKQAKHWETVAQAAMGLLEKYLAHVIECSNLDFLDRKLEGTRLVFTPVEQQILVEASARIRERQTARLH